MIDVDAEAEADGEDDTNEEQVADYVNDDLEICVEKGGGLAEDVAHGEND